MTPTYRLTPAADQDLSEIWHHTCQFWGNKQADKYLSELEACFINLLRHPELGKLRPEIMEGYRSLPKKHHLIFYRHHQRCIEVIRVLHKRMDVVTQLTLHRS